MIIKNFELGKIDISNYQLFLIYGKNIGLQNQIINTYFINNFDGEISKYEENEFIINSDIIFTELLNRSLFENKKILIISRASDKILNFIEELSYKNIFDVKVILKSSVLDKRSKLRSFFEKGKTVITIPTYEDNERNLYSIVNNFLNEHKIKISREAINLIINRSSGDRQNLKHELDKIMNYSLTKKNITYEIIEKLSNLSENYDVNELANCYLTKNTKNVTKIFNENNYSNEDCILILRTLLNKSKKLLTIINQFRQTNNLDEVISSAKPPIFWKDKEIIKIQVKSWKLEDLKVKIYELNEIEAIVKANSNNSLNLVSDFFVNY
tara:strand:+ start:3761 stop:4738 length:978 start_codon:yes stop_codon:yes gene_type:complete